MARFKIPRHVGGRAQWGGLDFKGWLGFSPFLLIGGGICYYSMSVGKMGYVTPSYIMFGFGALIAFIGYMLMKPLPQLTERPIVYVVRRFRARKKQKKFTWGRADD